MKQDALQMTLLFDYYGELLSQKQRVCFDLYYNQDLSLLSLIHICRKIEPIADALVGVDRKIHVLALDQIAVQSNFGLLYTSPNI